MNGAPRTTLSVASAKSWTSTPIVVRVCLPYSPDSRNAGRVSTNSAADPSSSLTGNGVSPETRIEIADRQVAQLAVRSSEEERPAEVQVEEAATGLREVDASMTTPRRLAA